MSPKRVQGLWGWDGGDVTSQRGQAVKGLGLWCCHNESEMNKIIDASIIILFMIQVRLFLLSRS